MKRMFVCICVVVLAVSAFNLGFAQEAEPKATTTLRIGVVSPYDANNAAFEHSWLSQYPDISIVYHLYTPEQLRTLLAANNCPVDILIVNNLFRDSLANSGLLVDLYEDGAVASWPEHYIDIKRHCEVEGRLVSLPRAMQQFFFGWSDELALMLGIEKPPVDWSWDDLLNLAREANTDPDGDGIKDAYLFYGSMNNRNGLANYLDDYFNQYLCQYGARADGQSAEKLEALFAMQKELLALDVLLPMGSPAPVFQDNEAILFKFYSAQGPVTSNSLYFSDTQWLPLPVIDKDQPGYIALMTFYCVLKSAPNPEAARLAMQMLAQPEYQDKGYGKSEEIFIKDLPKDEIHHPTFNPEAFVLDSDSRESTLVVDDVSVYALVDRIFGEAMYVPENYDYHDGNDGKDTHPMAVMMREHAYLFPADIKDIYAVYVDGLKAYLEEKITAKEAVQAIHEQIRMVLGE